MLYTKMPILPNFSLIIFTTFSRVSCAKASPLRLKCLSLLLWRAWNAYVLYQPAVAGRLSEAAASNPTDMVEAPRFSARMTRVARPYPVVPPRMRAFGLFPSPERVGFVLARVDHSSTDFAHPAGWLLIEIKPLVLTGITLVLVFESVIRRGLNPDERRTSNRRKRKFSNASKCRRAK